MSCDTIPSAEEKRRNEREVKRNKRVWTYHFHDEEWNGPPVWDDVDCHSDVVSTSR
jgi:hypothetical protein